MAEAIHELHEHAERTRENPGLAPATFTMSLLAVLVAAVSVLGHRAHTRTLLSQTKAADAWSQYEAKSIRRHNYELFIDLLSIVPVRDPAQAEKAKEQYSGQVQRYDHDLQGIKGQAESFEAQAGASEHQASRFDLGEVCLESALVITSITLITARRRFWFLGMALAAAGLVIVVSGAWVH